MVSKSCSSSHLMSSGGRSASVVDSDDLPNSRCSIGIGVPLPTVSPSPSFCILSSQTLIQILRCH